MANVTLRTHPPLINFNSSGQTPEALVIAEGETYSVSQLNGADLVAAAPGTRFTLELPEGTWSALSMTSQLTFEVREDPSSGRQLLDVAVGDHPERLQVSEFFWLQLTRTDALGREDVSFGVYYEDPSTDTQRLVVGRGSDGDLLFAGEDPKPAVVGSNT